MDKELTIQDLEAQADALLAAADEKNVLEVVAVLAEPAQHAPQHPSLDRDGNGREEEKDEQRPPGQVELHADEQKRQQHAKQDDITTQQPTEFLPKNQKTNSRLNSRRKFFERNES